MDVGNIAELNTFLVLDAIRSHGEATRGQLGRELGLSDASVSRIAKRLLATGIIEELPGEGAVRGRTPSILRFVGPVGGVIAVDLGGTRCHGALADLAGGTMATDLRQTSQGRDAAGTLLQCIAALESAAGDLAMPVRAVVVGIPALIDPVTQLATAGPNVHWQGFDLLGILSDKLAQPFEVDNDVNLAALGEAWRGQGRGVHSFVTMSLGTGIGGAVVIDGHLVRGSHNAAGEVAYFPFWPGPRQGYRDRRPRGAAARRAGFEDVASGEDHAARRQPRRLPGRPFSAGRCARRKHRPGAAQPGFTAPGLRRAAADPGGRRAALRHRAGRPPAAGGRHDDRSRLAGPEQRPGHELDDPVGRDAGRRSDLHAGLPGRRVAARGRRRRRRCWHRGRGTPAERDLPARPRPSAGEPERR